LLLLLLRLQVYDRLHTRTGRNQRQEQPPEQLPTLTTVCCCCRYVTGRTRAPGEINGKSGNLNNCLRNVIYADHEGEPEGIPAQELIVVFDADMAAKRHFFMKVLEVMWDEETALCLTPQVRLYTLICSIMCYVCRCLVP
jgi:hypothetical protein